ncbi:MAG: YfdX family protein [Candidatus Thiodiazotropha sp.]|jgi:hypothetical protein
MTPTTQHACLVSLLLLSATGICFVQRAAADTANSDRMVTTHRELPPSQPTEISAMAGAVIRQIIQAQRQISEQRRDLDGATDSLDQAAELLRNIQDSFFNSELPVRYRSATREPYHEKTPQVAPDLIPIFSSLSEIDDAGPCTQTRPRLTTDPETLQESRRYQARSEQKGAGDALLYVESDLPMKTTRQRIDEARVALQHDDIPGATAALSDARQQVVTISLSLPSPLIQAKSALSRTVMKSLTGKTVCAADSLADAQFYLRQALDEEDPITQKGVHELLLELKGLQHQPPLDSATYQHRLDAALARTTALSQREVDRLDNGWDRIYGMRAVKWDLIETRLQLAYARIDRLLLNRQAAAEADLKAADSFLRRAGADADDEVAPWLQEISLDLTRLYHDQPSDAQTYEQLQQKLTQLIHGR